MLASQHLSCRTQTPSSWCTWSFPPRVPAADSSGKEPTRWQCRCGLAARRSIDRLLFGTGPFLSPRFRLFILKHFSCCAKRLSGTGNWMQLSNCCPCMLCWFCDCWSFSLCSTLLSAISMCCRFTRCPKSSNYSDLLRILVLPHQCS